MEDKALNRLLKKLSAVRATLNQDERELLDGIIASARFGVKQVEDEVGAHAIEQKAIQKNLAVTEVNVHSMDERNVSKATGAEFKAFVIERRFEQVAEAQVQEVVLHALEEKHTAKALDPNARIMRVNLDKVEKVYKVV